MRSMPGVVQHTRHALHRRRDAEEVAGADAPVRVPVTLEGVPLQGRSVGRHLGAPRQGVERRRRRHDEVALLDPAALGDGAPRRADDLPVPQHSLPLANRAERHLVGLRNRVAHAQPVAEHRARRHASVVDDDGHVIGLVQTQVPWVFRVLGQRHGAVILSLDSRPPVGGGPSGGGSVDGKGREARVRARRPQFGNRTSMLVSTAFAQDAAAGGTAAASAGDAAAWRSKG